MRLQNVLFICMAAGLAAGPLPVRAAELKLPEEAYTYTVIDQDLRTALREFGANLGLRMSLSEAVQGRIRGRMAPSSPREFLDRLMAMYGLDWYYDGYTVSVTAQSEGSSKVISTPGLPFKQLKAGLEGLGVLDGRYVARPHGTESGLVMVGGPPRYIQLVEQASALLVAQAAGRTPERPGVVVVQGSAPAPPARPSTGMTIYRASQEQRVNFP